ncbi:hypothetical protein [Streptomyces hydrogenans]|uniref:hypothetical protein n=1 Tax=Streptomyces hydrogenans TaxID=1873719 RepID=UPI00381A03F7
MDVEQLALARRLVEVVRLELVAMEDETPPHPTLHEEVDRLAAQPHLARHAIVGLATIAAALALRGTPEDEDPETVLDSIAYALMTPASGTP